MNIQDQLPSPLRVLLVEDNVYDAELITRQLQRAGLTIQTQRVSTEQELEQHAADHWDVILTDYTLPSFDALGVLDLLAAHHIAAPCIIISGSISEEAAVECIKRGA